MFHLVLSGRFKKKLRDFLRARPELREIVREKLTILQENPHNPRLKTHKLTGKLKGFYAASITYEHRLVFYAEGNLIFLLALGTHDEVY